MSDLTNQYRAAEKLLPWNVKEAVLNGTVKAVKKDDTHFFYAFEQRDEQGKKYVSLRCVCTEDGSEDDLLNEADLCAKLGVEHLPVLNYRWNDNGLSFTYENEDYEYDIESSVLKKTGWHQEKAVSVSPDGKTEIFVRDYDLYMKDVSSSKETRMTFDGEKDFAYGKYAEYSGYITDRLKGEPEMPEVLWAPDSRHFLTVKLDQRNVKELFIIQSFDEETIESIRPRLHTYKCAFPEDADIPYAHYYIGDIQENALVKCDCDPQMTGGAILGEWFHQAKWLEDSSAVYTTHVTRGNKEASFVILYPDGTTHTVLSETSDTALNICTYGELDGFNDYCASNYLTADRSTVIWQSERDDYARLFRYDVKSGQCLNALTPASISVGELIFVDEKEQFVYFYASNLETSSDPYYQYVMRASFDGKVCEVLTPEDGMHRCAMINHMIIDTYSRVDKKPVTNLYRADGTFIRTLAEADIDDLLSRGYVMPERFTVTASDGKTTLYGILIKAAGFDSTKQYLFVDYIYGGMQCYNVPKAFAYDAAIEGREIMGGLEEMAQLGFCGIILDGLGTPGRGKKLHNISYENIHGCAGLKDHVYCLPELKQKYPFLDLERAGIWGNSGGGCATSRAMLEYPGTYKVGVSSAGNHDQRMYNNHWTETYYGLYDRDIYILGDNTALAKNLEGKLYIVHGAMDDNVAMSESIRLIDALIKEDKDFDFLILPRTNHNVPANPYFIRRKLDYFVRHLLQEEVPAYRFELPEELK